MNPSPDYSTLNIHTDGGARGNPGPAAVGFVISNQEGKLIYEAGHVIPPTTNNTAEYSAVISALTWLSTKDFSAQINQLNFFLDSNLVVNQLQGKFKIKQPHLANLAQQVHQLLTKLNVSATYTYIPRAQNYRADQLLNQALDK